MSGLPYYHAQRGFSIADLDGQVPRQETGDYLTEKMEEGFDYTTTRILGQEVRGFFSEYMLKATNHTDMLKPLSKEQIKESTYWREGVEYDEGTTEADMALTSEYYDMRRRRQAVIDNQELDGTAVLGFGAMMIGSLPAAESLIGFNAMKSGAKISQNLLRSAGVNMAVTGVADIPVLMTLAQQGEDVGLLDGLVDVAAAGLLGAGFVLPGALKQADIGKAQKAWGGIANKIMNMAEEAKKGSDDAAAFSQKLSDVIDAVRGGKARVEEVINTADAQVAATGDVTKVNSSENPRVKKSVETSDELRGARDVEDVAADHVEKHGEDAWGEDLDEAPKTILDDKLDTHEPDPVEVQKARLEKNLKDPENVSYSDPNWQEAEMEKASEAMTGREDFDEAAQAAKEGLEQAEKNVEATVKATEEVIEGKC